MTISPQYVDGLELRIKELSAERDALALRLDFLRGLAAEGEVDAMSILRDVQKLISVASTITDLESRLDAATACNSTAAFSVVVPQRWIAVGAVTVRHLVRSARAWLIAPLKW